jgi:hypothetical protein
VSDLPACPAKAASRHFLTGPYMSIPDLNFNIETAEALRFAASPHIVFKLRVDNGSGAPIHSVFLKCQIQLDVSQRQYSADEQQRLTDLFGEPERWGETLRSVLWTNISTIIPAFDAGTVVDLQVPCTFDFNVATTKYLAAISDGDIPVSLYFSGTIFYAGENLSIQAAPISWEKEAFYRMPVQVWREMMDAYYPNTAWLCFRRDVFDRLNAYKAQHGIPTFDQVLLRMMENAEGIGR